MGFSGRNFSIRKKEGLLFCLSLVGLTFFHKTNFVFRATSKAMNQLILNVNSRTDHGRHPARRLRREGIIPAVIYGKGGETRSLQVKASEFRSLLQETKGASALIELQEGSRKTTTIVKEVQEHPVKDFVMHIDFHEVSSTELMETQVAVHINGEAIGVKNEGGVLETVIHELTIRCLPKDLPEFIEVDVSDLKVGEAIHVKDLAEVTGVTVMGEDDQVIVSCSEPRMSAAPSEGEAAEESTEEEAPAKEASKEEG